MTDKAKKLLMLYEQSGKRKTMESAPPLTFKGYGKDLKNYRIYGNTVNGESVGDFVETGEHAGEYRVPVTVEGKNLLQNIATSRTINGVTFTVNEDGSITAYRESAGAYGANIVIKNGYNDDNAAHYDVPVFYSSERIIPSTNNPDIKLRIRHTDGTYRGQINNNEVYTLSKDVGVVYIEVEASFFGPAIIYPMIRRADISDDTYEPYQTTVTTNIYLPEQIKMVGDEAEYIDFGDQKQHFADGTNTDVTLPALPTLSGTNTLSVGTEVQPSNITITGKIKQI